MFKYENFKNTIHENWLTSDYNTLKHDDNKLLLPKI